MDVIRWVARISGLILFLFALPFYFGYGLPIPNSSLSLLENIHLFIMPVVLAGLLIGWKWELAAGCMICIPVISKLIMAVIFQENPGPVLVLLLLPGILFLVYGFKTASQER